MYTCRMLIDSKFVIFESFFFSFLKITTYCTLSQFEPPRPCLRPRLNFYSFSRLYSLPIIVIINLRSKLFCHHPARPSTIKRINPLPNPFFHNGTSSPFCSCARLARALSGLLVCCSFSYRFPIPLYSDNLFLMLLFRRLKPTKRKSSENTSKSLMSLLCSPTSSQISSKWSVQSQHCHPTLSSNIIIQHCHPTLSSTASSLPCLISDSRN